VGVTIHRRHRLVGTACALAQERQHLRGALVRLGQHRLAGLGEDRVLAEAYTNDRIARELVISPKTVERHRENILGRLGMRDRVEVTRYAIRHGLVAP
jgi:FixJ family two-component response regulator